MQKSNTRRKNLLRKGSFLPALFLFQTCSGSLEKSVQKKQGKCPYPFPDIEFGCRKDHIQLIAPTATQLIESHPVFVFTMSYTGSMADRRFLQRRRERNTRFLNFVAEVVRNRIANFAQLELLLRSPVKTTFSGGKLIAFSHLQRSICYGDLLNFIFIINRL